MLAIFRTALTFQCGGEGEEMLKQVRVMQSKAQPPSSLFNDSIPDYKQLKCLIGMDGWQNIGGKGMRLEKI